MNASARSYSQPVIFFATLLTLGRAKVAVAGLQTRNVTARCGCAHHHHALAAAAAAAAASLYRCGPR